MAVIYLRSTDGSDASDGSSWANAKATLAGAFTAASAGDTIYVSDNHAETQASAMTLTSPGTAASPVKVICVDDSAEPPTSKATTATISTTGNSSFAFGGFAYIYGISFQTGASVNSASFNFQSSSPWYWVLDTCKLRLLSTNNAAKINIGGTSAGEDDRQLDLINTTVEFGVATTGIFVRTRFNWYDTPSAVVAGTLPTTLIFTQNVWLSYINISGVDFSALGSGKNLVDVSGNAPSRVDIRNCKLGSSVSLTTGTIPGQGSVEFRAVNCDSGDTNYKYYYQDYRGTIQEESTIVRTGGASDGTTAISRKMVSSADAHIVAPLISDPIVIWNDTTGSAKTATIEVITDNVTLTDAECWVEIEYLGTSGFPVASFARDRVSDIIFGTPANQTTSTETWTTTGLTTPVKQKLAVTFTPQEKGPILARVYLAKASTTVYVDPLITIS